MDLELLIFDMDIGKNLKSKLFEETSVPSAPPPSPSLSSRRKPVNLTIQLSKLVDSCEDLISKTRRINIGSSNSSPLHMKRKTSDSDDCYSSGSSPGLTDYACSVGKRSRSSLNLDNFPFMKTTELSLLDSSISASSSICSS